MRNKNVHNSILEEQDEVQETYEPHPDEMSPEQLQAGYEEVYLDEIDELLEEEELFSEAEARIEQANLYQALLKANLFAPNSARPEIIEVVSKQFKGFIKSQLEILLGIRPEAQQAVAVKSPFSEEETDALKQFAAHMLAKKSGTPQQAQPTVVKPVPVITPVVRTAPAPAAPYVKPVQARQAQPAPRPAPRPQAPVQQPAPPPPVQQAAPQGQEVVVINGKKYLRRVVKNGVQQPTQAQAQLPQRAQTTDPRIQNVSIEGVNYAQAINTARPPLPMPSQAHIDMMNANTAEANAKGAQSNVSASVISKFTK